MTNNNIQNLLNAAMTAAVNLSIMGNYKAAAIQERKAEELRVRLESLKQGRKGV